MSATKENARPLAAPGKSAVSGGVLSHVVAHVSMVKSKEATEQTLTSLGAILYPKLVGSVTHLIWGKDGEPKTFWEAKRNGVLILPRSWVSQCEDDEEEVETGPFLMQVKEPDAPLPPPKAKPSMAPKAPQFRPEPESSSQRYPETSRHQQQGGGEAASAEIEEGAAFAEDSDDDEAKAATKEAKAEESKGAASKGTTGKATGGAAVVRGKASGQGAGDAGKPSVGKATKKEMVDYLKAKGHAVNSSLGIGVVRKQYVACIEVESRRIDAVDELDEADEVDEADEAEGGAKARPKRTRHQSPAVGKAVGGAAMEEEPPPSTRRRSRGGAAAEREEATDEEGQSAKGSVTKSGGSTGRTTEPKRSRGTAAVEAEEEVSEGAMGGAMGGSEARQEEEKCSGGRASGGEGAGAEAGEGGGRERWHETCEAGERRRCQKTGGQASDRPRDNPADPACAQPVVRPGAQANCPRGRSRAWW